MFTSPTHNLATKPVELFATLALALSTLVAVTVVSIGIARAGSVPKTGSHVSGSCSERANSNGTCSNTAP